MQHHYGYVRGTLGTDGDAFDCMVGDCPDAPHVYVINQMAPPDFTHVDEQKAYLAFPSRKAAKLAFDAHYTDRRFRGTTHTMTIERFRQKLATTRKQPRLLRG